MKRKRSPVSERSPRQKAMLHILKREITPFDMMGKGAGLLEGRGILDSLKHPHKDTARSAISAFFFCLLSYVIRLHVKNSRFVSHKYLISA